METGQCSLWHENAETHCLCKGLVHNLVATHFTPPHARNLSSFCNLNGNLTRQALRFPHIPLYCIHLLEVTALIKNIVLYLYCHVLHHYLLCTYVLNMYLI